MTATPMTPDALAKFDADRAEVEGDEDHIGWSDECVDGLRATVREREAEVDELRMSPCTTGAFAENGTHKCGLLQRAEQAEAERDRLRDAVFKYVIVPEYDSPGDTPEQVGWICLICDSPSINAADIRHDNDCPLRAALTPTE